MTNDRELLEAAAKAAGITGRFGQQLPGGPLLHPDAFYVDDRSGWAIAESSEHSVWNPLTDDGDALRLAVKLGFTVDAAHMAHWGMNAYVTDDRCKARGVSGYGTVPHGDDPMAATRRAIVKAAAALAPTP